MCGAQVAGMGRSGSEFKLSPSPSASVALQGSSPTMAPAFDRINAWQREERAHAAAGGCCGKRADGACSGKIAAPASPVGVRGSALALPAPDNAMEPVGSGDCRGTQACAASRDAAVGVRTLDLAEGAVTKQAAAPCCGTRRRRDDLDGTAAADCAEGGLGRSTHRCDAGGIVSHNSAEGKQTPLPALRLEATAPSPMDSCKRSKTDPASPRLYKVRHPTPVQCTVCEMLLAEVPHPPAPTSKPCYSQLALQAGSWKLTYGSVLMCAVPAARTDPRQHQRRLHRLRRELQVHRLHLRVRRLVQRAQGTPLVPSLCRGSRLLRVFNRETLRL